MPWVNIAIYIMMGIRTSDKKSISSSERQPIVTMVFLKIASIILFFSDGYVGYYCTN